VTVRILLALAFTVPVFPATELFSWHSFDTRLFSTNRFELALHHRTRVRQEFRYFDQDRVGPVARFTIRPRLTMIAGYYFQPQQVRPSDWAEGQRVFLGFETPLMSTRRSVLSLRGFTERHIGTGRPNYTRHRTSLRWTFGQGHVRPFLQNEVLAVWPQVHSTRNSGGLSVRLNDQFNLDLSYLYDLRRTFWGGNRQSIVSSIRWNPKFSAPRKR
jgi:hypothetical protein